MESDLLLIEMDEEDDDALIALPNQTPSKSSLNYFSFSPLSTNSLKDMEKASSSSVKASNNKENLNSNNVQVPNLGMKPMPMKMRNKGAGYNLRKSLAWDRAFFTDEGILDPYELTLITGINDKSRGGELPVMSEEGNTSCSSASRCRFEPNDSEAYEEVLSKELRDNSGTLKGKREKTCSSMGKHNSLAHQKVTNKVLSIDRTNRVRSKVGSCSEHFAASSLKRPANSNILKTTNKDSKLPKIPMSKPGSCISATTKGPMTPTQSRHSLIPRPTTNVQKDVGLKSSIKNLPGSQSKAKTGSGSRSLSAKELPKRTLRNLTNSSSKAASSTKSRLVQVDTTNSGSEMVPDRLQLSGVQEESTLATKNLAHDTATNSNNSITEAARLTNSGPCHNQRDSSGLMISDRLRICESKDRPASPAAPHHMNFYNTGVYPQSIEPARPSGLRLPSPSLRFFDQKTASESVPLQQKKNQQSNSNMSSNRKIDELRPPAVPARTPIKINNIKQNLCSELATSNTPCCNSQLRLSPNYMANTIKGVPYSNIYQNTERENEPWVDIMVQYECRGSELESHKVTGQKNQTLRYEENMELDKITCKGDDETKASHPTDQLEEGNDVKLHLAGNAGYNRVGEGSCQLMSEANAERVPLAPETKEKYVRHIEEDRQQNHNDISTSKEDILTRVDGRTTIMQDQTQTSREQSDTENSDSPNVDLESHLDAGRHEAEDWASEVFVEFPKDIIRKREDDVGATKCVGPGLEKYSVSLQHEKTGQENDIEVVDVKSLHIEADARPNSDSSCSGTQGSNSITSRDSLKDGARNGGNRDAKELKSSVSIIDTVQGHDDTDSLDVLSTDVEMPVLYDRPSAEGIHIDPSISIENQSQLQDSSTGNSQFSSEGRSVNCSQEEGPCANATEFNDDVIQETSGSDYSSAILMEVPVEEQNRVDVALTPEKSLADVQLGFREVSTLSDDNNRSSLSCLRTEVQFSSGTASGGDDALLKPDHPSAEGIHIDPSISIENQSQLQDSSTGNSQFSSEGRSVNCSQEEGPCANATEINDDVIQETSGSDYSSAILMEVPIEEQNRVDVALTPEKSLADVQLGFREVSTLSDENNRSSLSRLRTEVQFSSGTASGGDDALLKPKSVLEVALSDDTCPQSLEKVGVDMVDVTIEAEFKTNEEIQKSKELQRSIGSLSDCDILVHSCNRLSSELHDHSIQNLVHNDVFGKQLEFSNPAIEMEENFNAESCLSPREVADDALDEKRTLVDVSLDSEQVLTDNNRVRMKESLSPEKIADLDKLNNALESFIAVPEESIIHGCDLPNSNASSQIFPMVQVNVSDLNVSGLPNELQGFVGIKQPVETYDYFTNGHSGSCGQDPSESNSIFSVSQQLTTGVETTSTTLSSVTAELCSVAGGDESMLTSSHSIGEEDVAEGLQEEKSPMVGEFHHELESGSDLKKNKDATVSIKSSNNINRQDNSLVIHPPNAVPFSDEWLAAIEAAGEEILSMKCGAVQHSPPDKSVPEPSPWSPVKKKAVQLGPYDCTKYMNGMPSNPH